VRALYRRFYFLATTYLLDVLSNGNRPWVVVGHINNILQGVKSMTLEGEPKVNWTTCVSNEGEKLELKHTGTYKLQGKVEYYLGEIIDQVRFEMLAQVGASIKDYNTTGLKREGAARTRADWLFDTIGQLCIVVTQWAWTRDVEIAFDNMGLGQRDAMKDYNKVQIEMMNDLIFLVQGELPKLTRRTAMNLITMETHSRDIVISMIEDEFDVKDCFKWMGQMKTRFERRASSSSGGAEDDIFIDICDASFQYSFEYLGNPGRLVITPLTDRIYITATQASHLNLGCAPAGPAGTGKTESTKDLSAGLGKAVYVFNCGPEMDYRTMGDIFKGLGSSGTWGCFDEFNRLLPEVLSVCSVQYKAVLDGQLIKADKFTYDGVEYSLHPLGCMSFITMNPGYLGRAELPESLKVLFRY
jgi:dynein heavy chain